MIQANNIHTNLKTVTDHDFVEKILRADLPMVVDFWGEWCPPCRVLAPVYEQLSEQYAGRLGFAKLNIEEYGEVAAQLRILGAPTLVFFYRGQEIDRLVGPHPRRLQAQIERILGEHGL